SRVPNSAAVQLVSRQLPQLASSLNLETAKLCFALAALRLNPPTDQELMPKLSASNPMDYELRFKGRQIKNRGWRRYARIFPVDAPSSLPARIREIPMLIYFTTPRTSLCSCLADRISATISHKRAVAQSAVVNASR